MGTMLDGRKDMSSRIENIDNARDCMRAMAQLEQSRNRPVGSKVVAWTYDGKYCDGLQVVDRERAVNTEGVASG